MRSPLTAAAAATSALVLLSLGVPQAVASPLATPHRVVGSTARAAGAVTLGQIATTGTTACQPTPTMVQYLSGAGPSSYTTPSAGVITSYSVAANGTAGSVRLVIAGPSPIAGHRTIVAKDALRPVTVSTVNTFPVRIPVAAGLTIGISNKPTVLASAMICWADGVAGDEAHAAIFDPDTTTDYPGTTVLVGKRVNVSAVLEPDVDGDQFGDVSQDLCPQSALTQAACPAPDTTITKAPAKRTKHRKNKVVFGSVAGATFTCKVDGKPAAACTSPFKKKYKYGKHIVVVTATSPFGIVDPTPATATFKVKRPRR